jgi:hypothetical protein
MQVFAVPDKCWWQKRTSGFGGEFNFGVGDALNDSVDHLANCQNTNVTGNRIGMDREGPKQEHDDGEAIWLFDI